MQARKAIADKRKRMIEKREQLKIKEDKRIAKLHEEKGEMVDNEAFDDYK